MLQDILVMKTEKCFESRCLLPGCIPQHCIHRWCIDDLIRIEYGVRVPYFLDLLQQLVILFANHLTNEFAAKAAITMLATKGALVFFYQRSYFFSNCPE